MLHNLKKKLNTNTFNAKINGIIHTPPMPVIDAPLSIISMVSKSDILMYLLSMKSFYRRLGKGKLVVIIDRDTDASDRALMEHHFPGIRFEILEDIDPGECQRGGTWERLVYLIRRSQDEYVIQVDCDALVVGDDVQEVADCVQKNISFAYADNCWSIQPLREIAKESEAIKADYVGIALERQFATWPDADRLKYVRASSGLAGFAKGGASLSLLETFHAQMKESLGVRWREWGTEQSGSNFMVANSPNAVTLPYPLYATYPLRDSNQQPKPISSQQAKFFHFIGRNRFMDDYFARRGQTIITELMGPQVRYG